MPRVSDLPTWRATWDDSFGDDLGPDCPVCNTSPEWPCYANGEYQGHEHYGVRLLAWTGVEGMGTVTWSGPVETQLWYIVECPQCHTFWRVAKERIHA